MNIKNFWILPLAIVFVAFSCKSGQETNFKPKPQIVQLSDSLISYKYRIGGLKDSVVADSIWRMIFTVRCIEKLVILHEDSTVTFTVKPDSVKQEMLEAEIEKRGGKILPI